MTTPKRPPPKYKATRLPVPDLRADREAIVERMRSRTVYRENGCKDWTGFLTPLGYANVWWRNRRWMAHRLVYAAHYGAYDPWLDVRHSCDNPACVNVAHLSLGTRADNMRDSVDRRRSKNAKKTHCPRGHAYETHGTRKSPANRKAYKLWRVCSICERAKHRIRAGWPKDLAYSLPIQPRGYKPHGIGKWDHQKRRDTGD